MALLLHLDGPSGVGKSTLAERYADAHPGVLNCDVDRLRTMVGGWERDFVGAGRIVLPDAVAMIRSHLAGGRDVVMPQMLLDEAEAEAFRSAAVDDGHRYLRLVLWAPPGVARARFEGRGLEERLDAAIGAAVEARGGAALFDQLEEHFAGVDGDARVEVAQDLDAAYRALLTALRRAGVP